MAKHEHTFPDTGITVRIRKVSPLLMMRLEEKFPRPQPPKNKVVLDGREIWEDNPADPDFAEEVRRYEIEHNARLQHLLIRRGVDYEMRPEDIKAVEELRQFWKEEYNDELPGDDREVFVAYIAIGSLEDMNELTEKILNRIQPTEKTLEAAEDRFRAEVQGAESNGNASASVGDNVHESVGVATGR